MRKILFASVLFPVFLSAGAQEKVMNILKTDGTVAQTRVADLKQMSFLTVEEGGQGLLVKTLGGETATVLFEANPVVTVSNGKLKIKSNPAEVMEFEITDIEEILLGDVSDPTAVKAPEGLCLVFQKGGALLRGIPSGVRPHVYTVGGHSLPTPHFTGGELLLDRATLGSGVFIVKVGTFSAKVKF